MKRLISLCLTACMMGSLISAQAAAVPQNEQLEAVTKLVKAQLDIGDAYTSFYGELDDDGLEPNWSLHWESKGGALDVNALVDGTVIGYYRSIDEEQKGYDGGFAPALPKVSRDKAKDAATAFVQKVLRPKETVVFYENERMVQPLSIVDYNFYGALYYDGLPTPTTVSVRLRTADLSAESYTRNAEKRIGAIPSKTPVTTQAAAAKLLKDTCALRLQYTTDTADGKPTKNAVLRYVPMSRSDYFVDAQSGKLVDLTALRRNIAMSGGASADAAAPESGMKENDLSEAEQAGAALLKDALDKDALDSKLRAVTELGLSGFTAVNTRYAVDRDTGDISATLRYAKNENRDNMVSKYAIVDAKTGELLAISTRYTDANDSEADTSAAGLKKTEAFLQKYQATDFAKSARLETESANDKSDTLVYAQQVNGYPFPENWMRVEISKKNGTIDSFSKVWDDSVTFAAAEGIVSAEQALDSYFGAHKLTLGYVAVPMKLDPANTMYADYISRGYSYLSEWKLGFTAAQQGHCYGVDAYSGSVLLHETSDSRSLIYSDADAKRHPQAAALAQYGIGYVGGALLPEKTLTQVDLVALLMSADGYTYDPAEEGTLEQLYEAAYRNGILARADYAPTSTITRAALVKTIVSSTGYGKTADLPGIYRCTFTDEKSIPKAYYGYVATAQGMGLVRGDEKGRFQPNQMATREQAVIILYNFMSR